MPKQRKRDECEDAGECEVDPDIAGDYGTRISRAIVLVPVKKCHGEKTLPHVLDT